MKKAIGATAIVLILLVALLVAAYRELVAGIGCSTAPKLELWSADRAYKATLLEKYCSNALGGDTVFWKVRVDKPGPTASGGWLFVWDLENDKSYDPDPPAVRWDGPRLLRVDVSTDQLNGHLESHIDDLVVVRRFSPSGHPVKASLIRGNSLLSVGG